MSAEIIQFSTVAPRFPQAPQARAGSASPRELTVTCQNQRLRDTRKDAWDRVSETTSYWRARMDWHWELECAQKWGLADSGSFPPAADENRQAIVDTWREAVVKQLLTPAPTIAAVAWKRAKLSGIFPISPSRLIGSNA